MTHLSAYDDDAERFEKICEEKDITEPELISALLDIVESDEVDLDDWI